MDPVQRRLFLENFARGTHREEEHQAFLEWLKTAPLQEVETVLDEYNSASFSLDSEADQGLLFQVEAALDQYEMGAARKQQQGRIVPWRSIFRVAAASLFICLAGIGAYLAFRNPVLPAATKGFPEQLKVAGAPGVNKAILTLSDGSTVILDDAKNGQVAKQAGAQIAKLANGQLVYNSLKEKPADIVFNTLTTPRGGQFKLKLPDGSTVWLNAVSSIKYPTAFIGNERKVEITGEAYFEVAHDAEKPFKVSVGEMEVIVLGTHFNINTYNDETTVKTTLLEGSVNLAKAGALVRLKPGQQAQTGNSQAIKVVNNVDIDQVVAWKNGYFSFYKSDLQTVMRQISRWYDVDISYEGKIPERQFGGKIDRNSNITEVLNILEESKVHFKIEERKIIVLK